MPHHKYLFRRATPEDADAIRDLVHAAYEKWVDLIHREPLPMQTDYRQAVTTHRIDLLYEDDRLVALIEMIPAVDHLLIENVAVRPADQGAGYGRLLMRHADLLAQSMGLPGVRLYTNSKFTENIRFYRRLGYRVDREEPFLNGSLVHMSKAV
ncbi:GNAT family N-acetyltransferase [Amycolatopsis thermophila]|uniref:Ribosomal protein S18 acetylase RimI-like enzyme n=1 Tax=Amycolatopsis thermophila TaxID=206084 RepID=A0ABU0EMD9_9PSEU|nr:GNAT family N-acetyltransferase [Amycolatopsis thermophila]MDQ0376456.1 ribosomal protein S18 acetylase RimI-like enzyme [Amycolatopsis thermophila]